jgi:MFS family permease
VRTASLGGGEGVCASLRAVTDAPPVVSPLAPLRDPRFRVAWFAFLAAQVVIWAQTVGAVDVITRDSGSAALVSFIQTANSGPGVVLSLFAGAVADVVDRRRLLVAASLAMTVSMTALAALTLADAATPVVVLVATAALGAGLAMFLPAFSATVPDLVPRRLLASAVAMTNVSINVARALGPALAGAVIAVAGAGGLFGLLAGLLAVVVAILAVHGPRDTAGAALGALRGRGGARAVRRDVQRRDLGRTTCASTNARRRSTCRWKSARSRSRAPTPSAISSARCVATAARDRPRASAHGTNPLLTVVEPGPAGPAVESNSDMHRSTNTSEAP